MSDKKRDCLSEFLRAYDEYLDGKREYKDLPPMIYPTQENKDAE